MKKIESRDHFPKYEDEDTGEVEAPKFSDEDLKAYEDEMCLLTKIYREAQYQIFLQAMAEFEITTLSELFDKKGSFIKEGQNLAQQESQKHEFPYDRIFHPWSYNHPDVIAAKKRGIARGVFTNDGEPDNLKKLKRGEIPEGK